MKVMLIEMNYFLGGSIHSIVSIGQKLKEEGHDVYLVCPVKSEWKKIESSCGLSIIHMRCYTWTKKIEWKKDIGFRCKYFIKSVLNYFYNKKIYKIALKLNIDIVHINTVNFPMGLNFLKSKIPVVWHIREFLEEDHGNEFINKNYSWKMLNTADRLICISNSIYKKYSKFIDQNKLVTIYNGIDDNVFFRSKEIMKFHNFSIIGRIVPSKGQLVAAKACNLSELFFNNDCKLYVVGDGENEYIKEIKDCCSNIKSQMVFTGLSYNVNEYYKKTDVLLVCSKNEAFGRIIIEGMMGGSLVVASNTAGAAELIQDGVNGALFREGDYNHLALIIDDIIGNPQKYISVAKYGQEYAKKKYNLDKCVQDIESEYSVLLGNNWRIKND